MKKFREKYNLSLLENMFRENLYKIKNNYHQLSQKEIEEIEKIAKKML